MRAKMKSKGEEKFQSSSASSTKNFTFGGTLQSVSDCLRVAMSYVQGQDLPWDSQGRLNRAQVNASHNRLRVLIG